MPSRRRPPGGKAWEIHDAKNGTTLPGALVRSPGDPDVADVSVNEAATGITETLALFADYGRSSYDDKGATVVGSVHYDKDYDNAFWDGTQLVFGDGDGTVFGSFTKPIDVLGHELATPSRNTPPTSPTRASQGRSTSRSPTSSVPA